MQDEEVSAGRLERAFLKRFFEEVFRRGKVGEESAPGAHFGLTRALDYNVEVLGEG